MSSLVRTPVPPRIVLHAANVLRATEIRTWGHAAATVRWHPPEDGAAQLAVAHFKAWGPVYDGALSRLGDTQGPLLLMNPPALQPRCARSWTAAKGCEWDGRQSRTAPCVRTCLSTPSYICVSIVKITPCPPEEPTPLRFAMRLRIPKPMLPSPLLG